jgi:4'-phosphopantetheinyl transferase
MNNNKLFLLNIVDLANEDTFSSWRDKMPKERRERVDAMKVDSARRRCLGAGILLNAALKELGIDEYELAIGKHGKPYISRFEPENEYSAGGTGIFFNISHSGSYVVLALSDKEVGVDIQGMRCFDQKLIDYVFDDGDIEVAGELGGDDSSFTRLWALKESLMKYTGLGMRLEPKKIHVQIETDSDVTGYENASSNTSTTPATETWFRFTASCDSYDCSGISFTEYKLPGYGLIVCSEYADFAEITEFKFS